MRHLVEVLAMVMIVVLSSESVAACNLIQLVPTSCDGGTAWKYKESSRRTTNWIALTFNDKEWRIGSSGFGNMNKGGLTKTTSDYDLFVIGNEGLRSVSGRIREAAKKIDVEINPYVITPEEFVRRMKSGDHFFKDVMSSPKKLLKGDENEFARLGD